MYTVFGSRGFIGSEIVKFLNKKNIKLFIPTKKKLSLKRTWVILYIVLVQMIGKIPRQRVSIKPWTFNKCII